MAELVAYEENGTDAKSLDYARLVTVLVEAVKEIGAKNLEQQSRIPQLKSIIYSDHPPIMLCS